MRRTELIGIKRTLGFAEVGLKNWSSAFGYHGGVADDNEVRAFTQFHRTDVSVQHPDRTTFQVGAVDALARTAHIVGDVGVAAVKDQFATRIVNGERGVRPSQPVRVVNVKRGRDESVFAVEDIRFDLLAEYKST